MRKSNQLFDIYGMTARLLWNSDVTLLIFTDICCMINSRTQIVCAEKCPIDGAGGSWFIQCIWTQYIGLRLFIGLVWNSDCLVSELNFSWSFKGFSMLSFIHMQLFAYKWLDYPFHTMNDLFQAWSKSFPTWHIIYVYLVSSLNVHLLLKEMHLNVFVHLFINIFHNCLMHHMQFAYNIIQIFLNFCLKKKFDETPV